MREASSLRLVGVRRRQTRRGLRAAGRVTCTARMLGVSVLQPRREAACLPRHASSRMTLLPDYLAKPQARSLNTAVLFAVSGMVGKWKPHFEHGSARVRCSRARSKGLSFNSPQQGQTRRSRVLVRSKFVMMSSMIAPLRRPCLGVFVESIHVPRVERFLARPKTDLVEPCRIVRMHPPREVQETLVLLEMVARVGEQHLELLVAVWLENRTRCMLR